MSSSETLSVYTSRLSEIAIGLSSRSIFLGSALEDLAVSAPTCVSFLVGGCKVEDPLIFSLTDRDSKMLKKSSSGLNFDAQEVQAHKDMPV